MRTQTPVIRYLVLFLALVFSTATVAADSRSEAKGHYQSGVKLYNGGDYKGAIKEFSSAQELAPADLNNYNLALCYDKLGDPEPAIQYYRAYLDKQPGSDKKTEIEASVARLEKAAKSAAAKKAAKDQEEETKRIADQKRTDEEARKAEEAKRAEDAKKKPPIDETPGGEVGTGIGSTGTPGGTGTVSTGDAQLDRVQRIDINSVRDQRVGGQSSGMVAPAPTGPSTQPDATNGGAGNAAAGIDVNAHAGGGAPTGRQRAARAERQAKGDARLQEVVVLGRRRGERVRDLLDRHRGRRRQQLRTHHDADASDGGEFEFGARWCRWRHLAPLVS
jgi:Tetratricopeptide repeat